MHPLRTACCIALSAILLNPLLIAEAFAEQTSLSSTPSTSPPGQRDTGEPMDVQGHFNFTPYLWFAGAHGTTAVRGLNTSVHASAGDLLSHLDVAEPNYPHSTILDARDVAPRSRHQESPFGLIPRVRPSPSSNERTL